MDRRLGDESRVLAGLDCTMDSGSQDRSTRRAVTEMLGDTEVGSPVRVACSTHTRPSVVGPTTGAPWTAGWETWGLTVLWNSAGNESPPLFIQGPSGVHHTISETGGGCWGDCLILTPQWLTVLILTQHTTSLQP